MRHGQVYQLVLSNHGQRQCDAAVKIDGKPVGIWRVPPQRQIVLEHPSDQTGKFTFFLVGTAEAEVTNIREDASTGLVEAIFTPEKEAPLPSAPAQVPRGASFLPARQSSVKRDIGGTGLSGKSEQQYGTAEAIEYDRANQVTIQVRLVPSDAHLSGLQPLGGSQPSASFPLPRQQQTPKPANRWLHLRGLAFLLGAAALLGIVILLLLSYGGNFSNPLLPTYPQTSDGTPSYSTTSVSQNAQVNVLAPPKQTGEMPAVKSASAALTQVAIVWLLIFLVAKAFKKKTIGWTVTGTVSGILFILLGLGSMGDGPHAHNEAIKAAYLLAVMAFLPFALVMAFRRKTTFWIITGTLSGLCLVLIVGVATSVFTAIQHRKQAVATSAPKSQVDFSDLPNRQSVISGDNNFLTRLSGTDWREDHLKTPFTCMVIFEPNTPEEVVQSTTKLLAMYPELRIVEVSTKIYPDEIAAFKFSSTGNQCACNLLLIAPANGLLNATFDLGRLRFDRAHGINSASNPSYANDSVDYFGTVFRQMPLAYFLEGGWLTVADTPEEAAGKAVEAFRSSWLVHQKAKPSTAP